MWKMLKHIGQTHRRKLITTFSLVGLDNLLLLVYPVFGGWRLMPLWKATSGRQCCMVWWFY